MTWTLDYPGAEATLLNGRYSLVLNDAELSLLQATESRSDLETALFDLAERLGRVRSGREAFRAALKADKRSPAAQWEELWTLFH